jgi:hypothetical protein
MTTRRRAEDESRYISVHKGICPLGEEDVVALLESHGKVISWKSLKGLFTENRGWKLRLRA